MKTLIITIAFLFVSHVWASSSEDKAMERAEKLHQQSCMTCHNSDVYTRKDRKVNSLDGLVQQVKRCKAPARASWSEQEADWVVQYLNKEFYRF
jgi:hypothetical protein